MKLKKTHLIYFFTGYSTIQLIGYLGTAYAWLSQPMFILTLMLILGCILLGVSEWTVSQSREISGLSPQRILSAFSGSLSLLVFLLFILFVGVWIAS
jgi:hypothetical protein